ncbi:MAG: hypothetical protein J6U58_03495 [Bacteroidaceae bacterium]|nr:hypothetical protein [Bacteroidaceae bacterium]
MKKTSFLLLLILLSCGVSDDRIDAYEDCIPKVEKAETHEELIEITYNLSKQLYFLETQNTSISELEKLAKSGDDDALERLEAIEAARLDFLDVASKKETYFYMNKIQK